MIAAVLSGHQTQLALLLLAAVAILPLGLSLRGRARARSRRDAAIALHRAQLAELDRDLEDGRIAAPEHAAARLEVQRRLLAVADSPEPGQEDTTRRPAVALSALGLIPVAALALYMIDGHPELPSAPRADRLAELNASAQEADTLIRALQARLATLDQDSDLARQGYILLGNTQDGMGRPAEAAAAWRQAIRIRFDATLAAAAAEAQTRVDGAVSADSAALFRRALADAPADAPWRKVVEQRLAEAATAPGLPAASGPPSGTNPIR